MDTAVNLESAHHNASISKKPSPSAPQPPAAQVNYDKLFRHFSDPVYNLHQDQLARMLEKLLNHAKTDPAAVDTAKILDLISMAPAIIDNVALNNQKLRNSKGQQDTISNKDHNDHKGNQHQSPVNPTEFSPFHLIPLWSALIDLVFVTKLDSYQAVEALDSLQWLLIFRDVFLPIAETMIIDQQQLDNNQNLPNAATEDLILLSANVLESLLVFLDRIGKEVSVRALRRREKGIKAISDFYDSFFTGPACERWLAAISAYFGRVLDNVISKDTVWPRKSFFLFDLMGAIFQHPRLHHKFVSGETIRKLVLWGNKSTPKQAIYERLMKIFWTATEKAVDDHPNQELTVVSALSSKESLLLVKDRLDRNRAILESHALGSEGKIDILLDALTILSFVSVRNSAIIATFVELGITRDITDYCLEKLETFKMKRALPTTTTDSEEAPSAVAKWRLQTDYRLAYLLLALMCEFVQNHMQDPLLDRGKITDGLLIFLHQDCDPLNPRCKDLIEKSLIVLESTLEIFHSIHIIRLTDFASGLLDMLVGINGNISELESRIALEQRNNAKAYRKPSILRPSSSSSAKSISESAKSLSNLPFFSKQSYEHFATSLTAFIDKSLMLICSFSGSAGLDKSAIESQADNAILQISLTCLRHSKILTAPCLVKALFTLSSICASDPSRRDNVSSAIPEILKFTLFRGSDQDEEEKLVVAAIEAIWQGVVGHGGNEMFFFEKDGVSLLLNCLRRKSFYVKRHAIGCLLDLLTNETAADYVWEWRYPDDINRDIIDLICELWEREEAREKHQKQIDTAGLILETGNSRLLSRGRIFPLQREKVINTMLDNLGFKIYALICKIGIDKIGEKSQGNPGQLHSLTQIVKFYDLKISQAWLECEEELQVVGIRPVSPDQRCINNAKTFMSQQADEMLGVLHYLDQLQIQMSNDSEISHYTNIINRAQQ